MGKGTKCVLLWYGGEGGNVNSSMERGICGIRGLGGGSWGVH